MNVAGLELPHMHVHRALPDIDVGLDLWKAVSRVEYASIRVGDAPCRARATSDSGPRISERWFQILPVQERFIDLP